MRLGFFRSYDFVWKGSFAASGDSEASRAHRLGPFPAQLVLGVRAPVDPVTGMSIDLPLMDRKAADLLRLLSFSLATDTMPDIHALLANLAKRFEGFLSTEGNLADPACEVFHIEIRVANRQFRLRDGVFAAEVRLRSGATGPAGHYWGAMSTPIGGRGTPLRAAVTEDLSGLGHNLAAVLRVARTLRSPVRFRDWVTRQTLSLDDGT